MPRDSGDLSTRTLLGDVAVLAALHAAGCLIVRAAGFDHVSDDDFARVTIAQSFAHAPRLDPTGTSWLPFPFWVLGAIMAVVGRSLAAARAASVFLASLAAALPYVALRTTGSTRGRAALAVGFALLSPWSLWLGAATVPESVTASFTAAAVIALGRGGAPNPSFRAQVAFALALLAACLSRYEEWPVAAALALMLGVKTVHAPRGVAWRGVVLAAIVAAGPLLWIAWNAHAHGDALHFFQRVTRFKRALGEPAESRTAALLLYPRLFVTMRPDVVVAAASALLLALAGGRSPAREPAWHRWRAPLACVAAQIAFLAYGNVRDGAPAHHSERALLAAVTLVAIGAVEVGVAAREAAPRLALPALVVVAAAWILTSVAALRDVPGSGVADDRTAQVAAGLRLREEGADALDVTPCAYEHFALIAAFGAPERVTVRPSSGMRAGEPSASCPAVERR